MQQTFRESVTRALRAKEHAAKRTRDCAEADRPSSNLMRLLSSQIITRDVENAKDIATTSITVRNSPTIGKTSVRRDPIEVWSDEPKKVCPMCGLEISTRIFDAHLSEELRHLDYDSEPEGQHDQPSTTTRTLHENTPRSALQTLNPVPAVKRPNDPKIYVLGGAPQLSVPRDAKKFRKDVHGVALMKGKPRPSVRASVINHYADGGGFLDADELGLDGHNAGAICWEGVGATTM